MGGERKGSPSVLNTRVNDIMDNSKGYYDFTNTRNETVEMLDVLLKPVHIDKLSNHTTYAYINHVRAHQPCMERKRARLNLLTLSSWR